MSTHVQMLRSCAAWVGAVSLMVGAAAGAQVKTIPKEGIEGIPKEAVEFEIEHNFRREAGLGLTVPAEPGTPPGSTDPRNIEGIWEVGRTYTINSDGTFALESSTRPPAAATGMGAGAGGPPGAAPGGAPPAGGAPAAAGGGRVQQCIPGTPFTIGQPGKIVQTDQAIYIFKNGGGDTYRRIAMGGAHPKDLVPTHMGHALGHWEGDTLVVETVGLKGTMSFGMEGGGARNSFTPDSKVTERIKKIEGNMTLEDIITIQDPALKQPIQRRLTSYYRPDLRVVEAPCEEYEDPFEGQYPGQPGFGKPPTIPNETKKK